MLTWQEMGESPGIQSWSCKKTKCGHAFCWKDFILKVNILKAFLIGERNKLGIMPPQTEGELPFRRCHSYEPRIWCLKVSIEGIPCNIV